MVGGPKRSAPFYAGWDRRGKGGDLFNFKALAMVVRDGTAGGKGETEEYNYSLSIRLRSVFIFFSIGFASWRKILKEYSIARKLDF